MSWIRRLLEIYRSWKADRLVAGESAAAWNRAKKVLGRARCVTDGPAGPGASVAFEFLVLKRMIERHASASDILVDGLRDPNPFVAAYCWIGLRRAFPHRASEALSLVMRRSEIIRWRIGCRGMSGTVAEFAQADCDGDEGGRIPV